MAANGPGTGTSEMLGDNLDDDESDRSTFSITHRGGKALRITDIEADSKDAGTSPLRRTSAAWLFVTGTVPFLAAASALLWYDPSNIIATGLFWITAIPLMVAVPFAIIGSIYRWVGKRQS